MESWHTLARRVVFQPDGGRFLTVEQHRVELPDGQVIDNWMWLDTPDFVNVVLETEDGRFVCFQQTKYAAAGPTLGIVGGYIEPGEEPLAAAKREVLEETGYAAAEWHTLGNFAVDGNRGAGRAYFFLARGATWQQPIDADDLEEQELLLLTRDELLQAALMDGCDVLPWVSNIALALLKLEQLDAATSRPG
jgi:ADP-ribose pyrophosphatase